MKVAVLGGFGLMAEAALHDLAAAPGVDSILAADLTLDRAKGVLAKIPRRAKIRPVALDLTRTAAAARKLSGVDVILNCAWYEHNLRAMDLALAAKAHYVDLGGLYHMTLKQLKRDGDFARAGRLAVLGCGSTPGITNIMVARMAESFDSIDAVGIYDAGHDPALGDDSFLPPFSIRTMLAEYVEAAPVLKGGRIIFVPAHGEPETLDFKAPIGRVSAGAVIHSEAATLPSYLKAKGVQDLAFKIVYPESVKRQLAMLVAMGLHEDSTVQVNGYRVSPRHFVTALARRSAGKASTAPPRDFEILRVRLTGRQDGRPLAMAWDCEMRPTKALSAGAMGVGFAGSIGAMMLAQGRTRRAAGAGAPEAILDHGEFLRQLGRRRVFSLVETLVRSMP